MISHESKNLGRQKYEGLTDLQKQITDYFLKDHGLLFDYTDFTD